MVKLDSQLGLKLYTRVVLEVRRAGTRPAPTVKKTKRSEKTNAKE